MVITPASLRVAVCGRILSRDIPPAITIISVHAIHTPSQRMRLSYESGGRKKRERADTTASRVIGEALLAVCPNAVNGVLAISESTSGVPTAAAGVFSITGSEGTMARVFWSAIVLVMTGTRLSAV